MLKLMKHEFRATGRIMLPLYLLTMLTALGGNLSIRQLTEANNDLLNVLGVLLLTGFGIAIAAVCIMSVVVMIQRFYKSLLQDEGYVMLTLPVSLHQHIWAKLLVSTVWFAATAAVVAGAVLVLVYEVETARQIYRGFSMLFEELVDLNGTMVANGVLFGVELAVVLLLACFNICLEFYSALAIGHSFSGRKMLWSIAAFFALNAAISMLGTGVTTLLNITGHQTLRLHVDLLTHSGGAMRMTHLMLLGIIVMSLIQTAVYYLLTYLPMAKRLNLE